jgi:hypothetical protein
MAELKKVEVGLGVGQVVTGRLTDDALQGLRKAVEQGSGWHDLETEDGTVSLNLATVVFIKVAGTPHTVGFTRD